MVTASKCTHKSRWQNESLMHQESTRRCYDTVKHNDWRNKKCEDTAQSVLTGSLKYNKKICINRHVKYYLITEHILICGAAMETEFGEWEMLLLIQASILWSFDLWYSVCTKTVVCGKGIIHIFAQSIQITGQLFPRKLEPKILSRCTREREREREEQPERNDWQRFLFTLQVFTPFVANV